MLAMEERVHSGDGGSSDGGCGGGTGVGDVDKMPLVLLGLEYWC